MVHLGDIYLETNSTKLFQAQFECQLRPYVEKQKSPMPEFQTWNHTISLDHIFPGLQSVPPPATTVKFGEVSIYLGSQSVVSHKQKVSGLSPFINIHGAPEA